MATRMFEVQQKIFNAIDSSEEFKKISNGIYDFVPEKTKAPYATFGQILSKEETTKTDNGEALQFIIEIWSESKGRKEVVQILTEIEKALEKEITLDTASVIEQKVTNRDVVEEALGFYHATLEIKIILEWED